MVKIKFFQETFKVKRDLDLNKIEYTPNRDYPGIIASIPNKYNTVTKIYLNDINLGGRDNVIKYVEGLINKAFKKYDKKKALEKLVQHNLDLEKRVDALECHINALLEASTL